MGNPVTYQFQGGSPMKKLLSLIFVAMFALTMSIGTFASDDKSTASTKSTSSTKKSKKSKKSTKSTTGEKAPAAAPSK